MLAFATDYMGESTSTFELENTLKKISEAGFSHIHWCHEWDGDYIYSEFEMIQIRQWMDQYHLKSKGLHATEGSRRKNVQGKYEYRWDAQNRRDYTSENELNRLAGVELIKNRIDMAKILGSQEIVLHMQLPYKSFEEDPEFRKRYYQQVCQSFDELEYYCKAKGVKICIENLLGTPNQHQKYQFDLLFDRYDEEFLGFCFDTGHGFVTNSSEMLELAERYKERMFCIHMSDNLGLPSEDCWHDAAKMSNSDLHRIPYEGNFDWDGFARILAQSPYEMPVVLEISCKEASEEDFLKRALEAGNKFTDLVNKYRTTSKGEN